MLALSVAGIVVIAGCGSDGSNAAATTVGHSTSTTSASQTTIGVTPSTTGGAGAGTTLPGTVSTSPGGPNASDPAPPASDALLSPSGAFLSSHRLSLSGSGVPSNARSVCQTSPGASCVITFTNGSTSRSLPSQQVDAGGSTSWSWSVADVGLTAGHWEVQVTARRGAELRQVDEAIGLEVVD